MGGVIGLSASNAITSTSMWEQFQKQYGRDKKYKEIGLSEKDWAIIEESANLDAASSVMLGNGPAMNAYAKMAGDLMGALNIAETVRKLFVEYETNALDNEISNLQSIKYSLEDVNKQREKELELIKAKMNLENAQKEKKRVYREGVGFVYTTDQEAIKEAAENVDKLEREKDQNDLQYQIDMLNQQKEILANIEKNEQLEHISEMLEDYLGEERAGSIGNHIADLNNDSIQRQVKQGVLESLEENTKARRGEEGLKIKSEYDQLLQDLNEDKTDSWINTTKFGDKSITDILKDTSNPYYSQAVDAYNAKRQELSTAATNLAAYKDAEYRDENGDFQSIFANENVDNYLDVSEVMERTLENASTKFKINYNNIPHSWWGGNYYSGERKVLALNYNSEYGFENIPDKLMKHAKAYFKIGDNGYISSHKSISASDVGKEVGIYIANDGSEEYGWYYGPDKKYYPLMLNDGDFELSAWSTEKKNWESNAFGTTSFVGGNTLINERGLEGIITPEGTLTSLPAKSGILPADLTKNLWALGEVAPNLITELSGKSFSRVSEEKVEDNSMTVGTLNATFNTDSGFDAKTFWSDVKSQIALTKNNH